MEIEEFELLSYQEKDELILDHGIFLINYDEGNDMCDAYELFDFYVAICYKLDEDLRIEIVSAINPDNLPHLSEIEHIW